MRSLRAAAAVACVLVMGSSVAADVQATVREDIHIPAGELEGALRMLSAKRRIQFIFVTEDVSKLNTRDVSGSLTVVEALTRLLDGTGLTFRFVDDATVSILPTAPA